MRRQVRLLTALALSLGALAGCSKKPAAPAQQKAAYTGPPFRIDVEPPAACQVGAACAARLVVTALGDFKVNPQFPVKLVPGAGATPEGAFALENPQRGIMTMTWSPTAVGPAKVTGTLHLSVCNDDTCLIEEVPVAVDVPVS